MWPQFFIHEAMKGRRGIIKSKGNHQKLIMTFTCAESCLWNILFHLDLVVSWIKVEFGEKIGTTELIENITNDMEGKFIFDRKLIEGMKLKTYVLGTFFL